MSVPRGEAGWERLFWLVFDRTSNPVVLLDDSRRIVDVNAAAVSLLGSARDKLIGSSITDSIGPAEQALAAEQWSDFLRTGEYAGRRDLLRPDGSVVQVEFAARMAVVGGRRLAIYVLMPHGGQPPERSALKDELPLTAREREVVTLIALGKETGEIAAELHISPETVRTHVRNAMSKLEVHTRAQLVAVVLCAERTLHSDHVDPGGESSVSD
jgi:PAS domain S-box-containing protein